MVEYLQRIDSSRERKQNELAEEISELRRVGKIPFNSCLYKSLVNYDLSVIRDNSSKDDQRT